ncbi:phosphoribosyl-AMP cyclohydrolase [Candidatus Aerophobetes bacterium]|uniref:Phosphoribosyl-AMP cyclohydrolase n=1 Tax=Aerophobetes bacterium TaxID=2030807 RepID=A0A662DAW4_UNCAE|nr:MAG: phosphoribosyl-AMP cyclohydrolase [Candidatus Aerophobetes bacterium]
MEFLKKIKFNSQGLVPAIVQEKKSGKVLMLGWMNKEAIKKTISTNKVHFWSRSKEKIWLKGETSGHYQLLKEIYIDCDEDTLLIKVDQIKGACHKGYKSCFFRKITSRGNLKVVDKKIFDPREVYK